MGFSHLVMVVGNIGSFVLFCAFLFSNELILRVLTLFSAMLMIFYFSFIASDPLWINIFWKSLLILSTMWGVCRYYYARRHLSFSPIEKEIKNRNFAFFSDVEFKTVLSLGVLRPFVDGEKLIQNEDIVGRLFLLVSGAVTITDLAHEDILLRPGQYIGEMSFLSGNLASGTAVVAGEGCQCLYWMQSDLAALEHIEPALYRKLHDCFSIDVVQKLRTSS